LINTVNKKSDDCKTALRNIRQLFLQKVKDASKKFGGKVSEDSLKFLRDQVQKQHDAVLETVKFTTTEKEKELKKN
jgi:ribosome recycling factor